MMRPRQRQYQPARAHQQIACGCVRVRSAHLFNLVSRHSSKSRADE